MKGLEYIVIGVCLIVLVVALIKKEPFQDKGTKACSAQPAEPENTERVIMEYTPSTKPIKDMDDYDYVDENENDREISKALRNKLMSQRPMDWAGLPPSSSQFMAGLTESFQNASQTVPDDAKPYQDVNGGTMAPPDTNSSEMRERETLQTYVPKRASKEITYDMKDADDLIRKIYDQKGLIPTVAHKNGTNVYEIVGVRRKDEKIVYEDNEAPAASGAVAKAGEATIHVPSVASDIAAAKDPYYDTTAPGGRTGNWNFHSWTPGLERMFAPTDPKQNWY